MKQTAVIYARFSSHSQTEQSIEGQLRECYAFAKRNDLIVVGEYIDRAISGTTDKRPDFLRMIDESKNKDFDYVLVYQLDRFARNRYDSAYYKNILRKNNVKVLSAKENISDDPSGSLMESVLEGMAEYYSRELAQKVKRGIRESLIKGNYIGGHILYGYGVVNKKYVINEAESQIVKQIFEDYANGKKTVEIVDSLNNAGITTKQGLKFTINIISKMLRNTKYIGKCTINEVEYTNIFPQIIEESIFRRCNLIMDEHKHRQRQKQEDDIYILSGKLYCGHCGNLMTAETGTSKTGAIHKYYKCYGKKKKVKDCTKHNVRKEDIENFVFEKTKEYVLQTNVINDIADVVVTKFNAEISQNAVLIKLEEELKQKEKAISSMLDAIEKGIFTTSTQERLVKLENEKAVLEDKIAVEQAHNLKPLEKKTIVEFLNIYMKSKFDSVRDKNDFFNNFILRVNLYDDKITIVYNTSLNPSKEVYFKDDNKPDDNLNDGGTTIFSTELDLTENNEKSHPNSNEFKRQFLGGESKT